jgi:hypothetical protein
MLEAVPAADARPARPGHRGRFGLLLAAIIATFVTEGVASPGDWQQVALSVLLVVTLLVSLWVADVKQAVMSVAVLISAAVVVTSLIESLTGNRDGTPARVANLLLVALAPPFTVIGIVRTLQAQARVTISAVFGVLCLYMLIGMFFASLYGLIDRLAGGFFAQDVPASLARCLYFSFTTLTTVGYGDLTATSNLGHTLSVSEALLGQVYLVTIVAVIVSNLDRTRRVTR